MLLLVATRRIMKTFLGRDSCQSPTEEALVSVLLGQMYKCTMQPEKMAQTIPTPEADMQHDYTETL